MSECLSGWLRSIRTSATIAVAALLVLAPGMGSGIALAESKPLPMQSFPGGNPNYNPPPAKEGYSYPDCYCTDSVGQRVEMGQYTCLRIGGRDVLARCEMSVNNPTWRHQEGGCPGV